MKERKGWTLAEDQVLRVLRDQRGQIKWSNIARMMQLQFGIPGKTGKQCRERYHNHLKPAISHAHWRPHEDALLLQLHRQCGNKWSAIAQSIPGRTQNCVKNHFYSKLRKVVRRLNRIIAGPSQSSPSIASLPLLSRIIAASQCRFRPGNKVSEEWVAFASALVDKLYNFQSKKKEDMERAEQQILSDMAYFDLNFKKRKCRKRDMGEMEYRQRKCQLKTAEENDLKQEETIKEEELTVRVQVADPVEPPIKVQGFNLSQIFPLKPRPMPSLSKRRKNQRKGEMEGQGLGQSNSELQVLQLSECGVLAPTTLVSLCELQSWGEKVQILGEWQQQQKVHILQESEQYAFNYGYPLEL